MMLTRKEAIDFLNIPPKNFDNYFKSSKEIIGKKISGRWNFSKADLDNWNKLRRNRTVILSMKEYEACFEFAIKMAYSTKASHGTGIRGVRSEVQMSDDFILGILAEHAVKKFLRKKFNTDVFLDMEVHPANITPQDFVGILDKGKKRNIKLDVAVKSSKMKSCFNIIPPIEYENEIRRSDVYIFARVGLPSDHLFRILREHSFFKKVREFLDANTEFRKIEPLDGIPVWITGFNFHREFKKVTEIPGQKFDGYRYVVSTSEMHNSKKDWEELIKKL